ncbi:hypothetical protein A5482_014850 (plasmid) [Cyanobacterium sp. IPPAS B-1200]|uniref:hypothetical protein n=1 Tax=Cyanobacterium sp. IPPAS B-1200 TaxID=1562720 RepID=UPI0008527F94|nr:hypothetical protein [Cyanobacterium sp. IPPAS B-1200]OEJ78384.1 hypothetical protein A5482_13555 [Cyanobacterium sp. IPPAS B-1200]
MPSSLPKYSGLITEHQLSMLNEFISLHDGVSKARVLGRLLEAWHDAGKPILENRDGTLRDLALQFEQLDLDALVKQKVSHYLDTHLDSLVNNLVENKLRPLSHLDSKEDLIDSNLVNNKLLTNGKEDNITTDDDVGEQGALKVIPDISMDEDQGEVISSLVQEDSLEAKQESETVNNNSANSINTFTDKANGQDNGLAQTQTNKGNNKDTNLTNNLSNENTASRDKDDTQDIDVVNTFADKDNTQGVDVVNTLTDDQDTSLIKTLSNKDDNESNNLVNTFRHKHIEANQNLINSEVINQTDVSHIPADFLALPKGKVQTKILAQALGLSSPARVTDLASGKRKAPFPEFWDYMKVETTIKTTKNGKHTNFYEWFKVR